MREFKPSFKVLAIQVAMAFAATILGLFLLITGTAYISGFVITLFCGFTFFFLFGSFKNNKIIVDGEGLLVTRFCEQKILWEDIKEYEIDELPGNVGKYLLNVSLNNREKYQFKALNKDERESEKQRIGFVGFEQNVEEIVTLIKKHIPVDQKRN